MQNKIQQKAPEILESIKKANNILLHLHVKPDPDSIGSALAMKWVLQGMGKNVTVIKGDSELSESFVFLPGANEIVHTNYFETDLSKFDLFIILDSGSKGMISREGEVEFPENLKTIVIDHHISNEGFADINLIDPKSAATSEILFYLFKEWGIEIDKNIAASLYIGIWGDTGSFGYSNTTSKTLNAAADLVRVYPDFRKLLNALTRSKSKEYFKFIALALNLVDEYFDNSVAISAVPFDVLKESGVDFDKTDSSFIPNFLISIKNWEVGITMVEVEKDKVKMSFRSKDGTDVSKIAGEVGGGGHAPAAGAFVEMPLEEAKKRVIEAIEKHMIK